VIVTRYALVVIDMQEKLLPLIRGWREVLTNVIKLVKTAKVLEIPIVATEQYPKGLGRTVPELVELLGVRPLEKTTFSCFGAKGFEEKLRELRADALIVTGIEAHICVTQTVLDALDRGFKVYVPADATGSRRELDWLIALDRMRAHGADVATTEMVMFELIHDAARPEFKEILKLVKEHS